MDYYRPANARGQADFGWLQSQHSFSFGSYYDPKHMGISALRVINDDRVAPGAGFETHPHRDMEIISYILEGEIAHKDSIGHEYTIPAGEVQVMSAGTGITHSEYNASKEKDLKFLQIWVLPETEGLKPSYEQKPVVQKGALTELVTPDGRGDTLKIHQDVTLSRLSLKAGEKISLPLKDRTGYIHVIKGSANTASYTLYAGDGLGLTEREQLHIKAAGEGLEALWFDLP